MNIRAFLGQTLLLCALLWLVWRALRWFRDRDPLVWRVVAFGFLVRSLGGVAAFFISYFQVPAFRGYILREGVWFFARDAALYFRWAEWFERRSFSDIVVTSAQIPSASYIQVLAVFCAMFGLVTSVAILINLITYLGTCAVITNWHGSREPVEKSSIAALVFIAMSPSWILWSTQPLKDPMFAFLLVVVAWTLAEWARLFARDSVDWGRVSVVGAVFVLSLAFVTGVRWYFGVLTLAAAVFFHLLRIIARRDFRPAAVLSAALVLVIAGQVLPYWGGVYVPRVIRGVLTLGVDSQRGQVFRTLDEHRRGFETTDARTQVRSGPVVRSLIADEVDDVVAKPPNAAQNRRGSMAETNAARGFLVGGLSMVCPRFIGQPLGLFEIAGGKGLWWFADADTLFFDGMIVIVAAMLWRNRKSGILKDPLVVTMIVFSVSVAGLLAYVVTNFGTLMRLRMLVFVFLALLPVAASAAIREEKRKGYHSFETGSPEEAAAE